MAKLGGKVIARISVRPLTVSDNPNCVQLSPNFAKPPGRYRQAADSECGQESEKFIKRIYMDKLELLEQLIFEGDKLASTISYVPAPDGVIRTSAVYSTTSPSDYQDWKSAVERLIKTHFSSDLSKVEEASKKLSPDNHRKILGILKAIRQLPSEPKKTLNSEKGTTVTITNSQQNTQNNTQEIIFNIFVEAVQDELTGKEMKELKEILLEFDKEPEKTKSRLLDKLKKFGGDVLASIVANIITNPNVYSSLT